MSNTQSLKEALHNGETTIGTWGFVPHTSITEMVALAGFDFEIIDMEHTELSYEKAIHLSMAAESHGMDTILRVPQLNSSYILRALDIGADGVQIPHITTKQDAKKAVSYSKYHPVGERGLAPNSRAGGFSYENRETHAETQNEETVIILNVEGKEGIENLSEILEVDGYDVIFLGPYDISQAVGRPGEIAHPEVKELLKESAELIHEYGKCAGCFAQNEQQVEFCAEIGVEYLTYSSDGAMSRTVFDETVEMVSEITG
jgi:4-hydroxy-2-oxoheptanedioate aldolase